MRAHLLLLLVACGSSAPHWPSVSLGCGFMNDWPRELRTEAKKPAMPTTTTTSIPPCARIFNSHVISKTIAPVAFFFFMIIILLFLLLFVAHLVGRTCVPGHGGTDFFTWAKKGGTTTKNKRERKRTWKKVGWISWNNPEDFVHSSSFLFFSPACIIRCVCVLQNDLVGHVLLDTTHKSQSAS